MTMTTVRDQSCIRRRSTISIEGACVVQARDPGLVPDPLTDLYRELVHGASRADSTIRSIGAPERPA